MNRHSPFVIRPFLLFCSLYFVLFTTISVAQEKTHSSATINSIKYYLHTVEKGQTLFAIAKLYDRSVNDIVIENPEAIDGISPGQVLKIPVEKKITNEITNADTSNCILHKVEKGQTLYSISKQYNVAVEKIKTLNPSLKEGLKIGQTIKIPSDKPKTESTVVIVNDPSVEIKVTDYPGELKEKYNIAFFLPFHADEAISVDAEKIIKGDTHFSNKTSMALQFYEGSLLALDSLKKQKLNAKIFVYDMDDQDSLNIVNILKKPELATMDLIIGPLYGAGFMPVSKFAKEHNIPIVSPFTQVNKILFNNPYVCKVSPSSALQIEQMAHFVVDTFQKQNIILVNTNNVKEESYFNTFRTSANQALLQFSPTSADSIKIANSLGAVQSMLKSTGINVIALLSNNQSYVSDFISKLNAMSDKNKIVLFGLPSWNNYDNLDFEYLNNLSLHIPSGNYIDYQNTFTKKFIRNYRSKYKTEPEMYAFQGFDVTYYFMALLQKYGGSFLKNITENKYNGIENNFQFSQFPSDSGFENKFVFILKYQDFKLVKAN